MGISGKPKFSRKNAKIFVRILQIFSRKWIKRKSVKFRENTYQKNCFRQNLRKKNLRKPWPQKLIAQTYLWYSLLWELMIKVLLTHNKNLFSIFFSQNLAFFLRNVRIFFAKQIKASEWIAKKGIYHFRGNPVYNSTLETLIGWKMWKFLFLVWVFNSVNLFIVYRSKIYASHFCKELANKNHQFSKT